MVVTNISSYDPHIYTYLTWIPGIYGPGIYGPGTKVSWYLENYSRIYSAIAKTVAKLLVVIPVHVILFRVSFEDLTHFLAIAKVARQFVDRYSCSFKMSRVSVDDS